LRMILCMGVPGLAEAYANRTLAVDRGP
jgi:hypothetical protein